MACICHFCVECELTPCLAIFRNLAYSDSDANSPGQGLSSLVLREKAISSCWLPSFKYLPPSLSEVAEMEQNHERSLTLATRESMLDIDDIFIDQAED